MRRSAARASAVVAAALVLGGCAVSEPAPPSLTPSDVGVQLFQLPWTSIATECEEVLAPGGFAWVLTSPPNEHIDRDEWWASYQPVSHLVESRLGTREEFADMVARCAAVGVDVIADAVINHMTGQDVAGVGWAGTPYEHYEYPGLYEAGDFHHCGLTTFDDIEDYHSREQVQTCELVNLADLDTASPSVQARTVDYLTDLVSLGVAGFRIDAAKHMSADDVREIIDALPYEVRIISEVIRGGGEPVTPEEYTGIGEVFEFTYGRDLTPALLNGVFSEPELGDERPLHVDSDHAVVFVDNHDTERGEAKATYRKSDLYVIANALMLADDYGSPVVYSGYAFSDRDAGAPVGDDGRVLDAVCPGDAAPRSEYRDGDRTCVHAWDAIAGMVEFRRVAGDAARVPGIETGDAYGFERLGRGVVAVNVGTDPQGIDIPTSLPDGTYCDVVAGPALDAESCAGDTAEVADGAAHFTLPARTAAAIHLGSRT